ncbi:unnamed protein product [Caenorhabditis angaria]|uniref:G-protein coupled receptors family 1 profile domain-containing protein n=1 Tax=Caenorhabditis angaria TaxID=860376 RepID=A0A9P1IHW6_9PELO|nr:unnamed protein product [Caenorhabditis angaria]
MRIEQNISMFINFYYIFFTILAIPVNLLLIYLILFKSPTSFQSYRFLLLNTAVNETFLIVFSFFLQIRIISAGDSIALLSYGPSRLFSVEFNFIIYNIYNVFLCTTNLSLIISMHYRYCVICYGRIENTTILRNLSITTAIPLAMLIAILIPPFNFSTVVKNTEKAYPSYNLSNVYGNYGGFYSTTTIIYSINTGILMGIPYLMPIFILYCRRKIFKQINEVQTHLSDRTKKASLDLVRALTMQSLFPMICLIPNVVYFLVSQKQHMEIEIAEYLPFPTCCLPCLIDPLLTIKYVAPYRNFITRKDKRIVKIPTISVAPSSIRTF